MYSSKPVNHVDHFSVPPTPPQQPQYGQPTTPPPPPQQPPYVPYGLPMPPPQQQPPSYVPYGQPMPPPQQQPPSYVPYGQPMPPPQPQPQPPSYRQPTATGNSVNSTTPSTWSTGLCGCCSDVSNCCITCWCPCITFGQIAEIVDEGRSSCALSGGLYALLTILTGCGCLYSCFYRSKMRNHYLLPEGPCGDCLLHFFCEPCALCQEYRELQNRGFAVFLGWERNEDRKKREAMMAPVAHGGMSR